MIKEITQNENSENEICNVLKGKKFLKKNGNPCNATHPSKISLPKR